MQGAGSGGEEFDGCAEVGESAEGAGGGYVWEFGGDKGDGGCEEGAGG